MLHGAFEDRVRFDRERGVDDVAAHFRAGAELNLAATDAAFDRAADNHGLSNHFAFDRAGFATVDVHMSDIIAGRSSLKDFRGFAACGGFSYGDVLGAGEGSGADAGFMDPLEMFEAEKDFLPGFH